MIGRVPPEPLRLSGEQPGRWDAMLASCGYERRSRSIPEHKSDLIRERVACTFPRHRELAYDDNRKFFAGAGWKIRDVDDAQFADFVPEWLESLGTDRKLLRVAIDISSMTRDRMAHVFQAITTYTGDAQLSVDLLYTPAEFSDPPAGTDLTWASGPVTPWFAGWTPFPNRPIAALVGLGYETDKAVGALEYIEPGRVWIFTPTGEDDRYDSAMEEANPRLLEDIPSRLTGYKVERPRVPYRVDDPFECCSVLESLVYANARTARPVMVPLGPKIFAACCLAVASLHRPKVAVWRVSSGPYERPVDRESAGKVIGLRLTRDPSVKLDPAPRLT